MRLVCISSAKGRPPFIREGDGLNDSTFSPVANGQGEKADAIGYELDNDEDDEEREQEQES